MKKLLFILLITTVNPATGQHRYYASIFDKEYNPLARGIFLRATESDIVIEVEKRPIRINVADIYLLNIERNPAKLQFIKLGAAVAAESLVNASNKESSDSAVIEPDSTITITRQEQLVNSLQEFLAGLLDKTNDIASIVIDGSEANLKSKLSLLQQYSFETELKKTTPSKPVSPQSIPPIKNKTPAKPAKPVKTPFKF